jgi:hypothetical protein
MTCGTENIMRVFRLADSVDLEEGAAAYFRYRETMLSIGREYGYPLEATAAAFAALSPNNDYAGNLRALVSVMRAHREGRDDYTVTSYRACAGRAMLYLSGTPFLSHAKGPKTRAFYVNITQPWLPHVVTVDGHMVSVWKGERLRMKEVGKFRYEVVWFTWKRINNVVYDPQMSMLREGDQWGLVTVPGEVRPYEPRRAQVPAIAG